MLHEAWYVAGFGGRTFNLFMITWGFFFRAGGYPSPLLFMFVPEVYVVDYSNC